MLKHEYFGEIIVDDWNMFFQKEKLSIPHFEERINVNLMEYDEDFEPIEEMPNEQVLNAYADTLKKFLADIDNIILDIQEAAFNRYIRIYAKYYEKPFEVIFENQKIKKDETNEFHQPLNIDTTEKHFEYMNSILEKIVISKNQTIVIPLCYDIDEEHGLEIKIRNNKVVKVGGIGETTYE